MQIWNMRKQWKIMRGQLKLMGLIKMPISNKQDQICLKIASDQISRMQKEKCRKLKSRKIHEGYVKLTN